MRVARNGSDDNLRSFDQWLLRLGNGTLPHVIPGSEMIFIPVEKCITINANSKAIRQQSMREVINFVFPNLTARFTDRQWLSEWTILAPKNTAVDEINNFLMSQLRGEEIICKSADSTVDLDDATHYTTEYLNTINSSGMPAHRIVLKINCPLILLRNLNPSEGLCNGTRLILNKSLGNVLHCTIVGGTDDGREVFIPRITLKPNEEEGHPVEWQRRQFPVQAAFSMTINKSQGQTLSTVVVWLEEEVFGHGQLYVASSRVGHPDNIMFAIKPQQGFPPNATRNVVYREILSGTY